MNVRAKFIVQSIEKSLAYQGKEVSTIKMAPVYSQDPESENRKFWEASPSGSLLLAVINKQAADQFILGREYYLDFTEAPVKEPTTA
jgi:hypothetical protein